MMKYGILRLRGDLVHRRRFGAESRPSRDRSCLERSVLGPGGAPFGRVRIIAFDQYHRASAERVVVHRIQAAIEPFTDRPSEAPGPLNDMITPIFNGTACAGASRGNSVQRKSAANAAIINV